MIPIFEPEITELERKYVTNAVKSGWISSQGEYIHQFEKQFASRFKKRYGIATTNCTTALHLSLVALNISAGDEVICPNFTFIAPANMIQLSEAKTVLVDVEVETWNMDPELVRNAITENTKAIVGVRNAGKNHDEYAFLL